MDPAIRIVVVAEWVAMLLGMLVSASDPSIPQNLTVAATVLGGTFVATHTLKVRPQVLDRGLYLELLVIAGAVLTVGAASLTGGADSPFLLLALTPTLLAAIAGGMRLGLATSLLTAGLLAGVTIAGGGLPAVLARLGQIALFPLSAILFGQIRSLLVASESRAVSLEEASAQTEAELARLGQANELLTRLTDLYGNERASPVEVGTKTLQAIVDSYPGSFATATLYDVNGPVVVARVGTDSGELVRTQIPLGSSEEAVGVVSLATPQPLTTEEERAAQRLLRPVAVAFANTLLLQGIAATAVREERLRLARELHDEVGPALAALGLSLDATQMQASDPVLTSSLGHIREGLTTAVEDLRGIIADLRSESAGSLVASLHKALGDPNDPEVSITVHEHRKPQSTAMRQILAIATEAIRNAQRHAEATTIIIDGTVDRDRVDIEIRDDGTGFDPTELPDGHYGVLGMRERADRIGAKIDIRSGQAGTTVRLTWKEKR